MPRKKKDAREESLVPTATAKKEPAQAKRPKGAWFKTGDAGAEQKRQNDAAAEARREKAVSKFYLKDGEEAALIWGDNDGFYCYVHTVQIGPKRFVDLTCTKDFTGECVVCARESKPPTYTAFYTVIDPREFIRKSDGKKVKNRKILFPAKGEGIKMLNDLKKKVGNLTGLVIDVKRYGDKSPNSGNSFIPRKGRVDIAAKLGRDMAKPIDYETVLAPPTEDELAGLGIFSQTGHVTTGASAPDESLDDILG